MVSEKGYETAAISVERKTGHDLVLSNNSYIADVLPSNGTTLVYNRNLSSDLVWNSNTNQYGLAHGPVGDNLYAYTDPNVSEETTLYAWIYSGATVPPIIDFSDYIFYTTASQIQKDLIMYANTSKDVSGFKIGEYKYYEELGETGWEIIDTTINEIVDLVPEFTRDSSEDVISQPATLYTNSTTLTTGMTLYSNTGTDTGYKVGAISGNSFDIQNTITVTLVVQSIAGAMYGAGSGTVNSIAFTSDGNTITPNTIEINTGESCIITALNGKNSDPNTSPYETLIHLNGTQVASHCGTAAYTFTPTEDCTIGINFGIEKSA